MKLIITIITGLFIIAVSTANSGFSNTILDFIKFNLFGDEFKQLKDQLEEANQKIDNLNNEIKKQNNSIFNLNEYVVGLAGIFICAGFFYYFGGFGSNNSTKEGFETIVQGINKSTELITQGQDMTCSDNLLATEQIIEQGDMVLTSLSNGLTTIGKTLDNQQETLAKIQNVLIQNVLPRLGSLLSAKMVQKIVIEKKLLNSETQTVDVKTDTYQSTTQPVDNGSEANAISINVPPVVESKTTEQLAQEAANQMVAEGRQHSTGLTCKTVDYTKIIWSE